PDPVDQALGEERIGRTGQPRRQARPAVARRRGRLEYRAAQCLRRHGPTGAGLPDVAGARRVDHFLIGQVALLPADLREEGGEAVIIILGPPLEGMVMALRALDAYAQEELGRGLDRGLRVAADPVIIGSRILVG